MKILPRALRLACVVLGVALSLATLAPPASATAPVHLSGTVTNTDGVPQNGNVYVKKVGANQASGAGISNGSFSWDWNTDQNPEGDYLVFVHSSTMDGLERWYVAGDPGGTTQENLATPVHLGPGAPDLNIAMVLPAIAQVSGRLVGNDGLGVPGLSVTLSENGALTSFTSGPGGIFDLGYVRAGSWKVLTGGSDYLNAQADVVVPATGSVVMPDLVVHKAASIEGQVSDSVTGDPVPFVQVAAFNATTHAQLGQPANTDASGHYRIGRLGGTPFVLRFIDTADSAHGYGWTLNDGGDANDWSPQTPITLAEGESRAYDQQLVLKPAPTPPAHTLAGTVTDKGGHPLVGIDVTTGDLTATTDRRGHWFLDAPAGQQSLRINQNQLWSQVYGTAPGWFPASVTAVAGGAELEAALVRAGRISGVVLAASGLDVGEHELWLYDAAGILVAHEPADSGDGYWLDAPAGVPLYLVARGRTDADPVTELLPRWFGDVDSRAASTPIQVGPGETVSAKDFQLTSGLTNLMLPAVAGLRAVGRTLTATTGTWSTMTMTGFTTTWWRGSLQVGSGQSYVVKPADAGSVLRARVVAKNGTVSATALTLPAVVAKVAASVGVRATSPRTRTVRLAVAVRASGLVPAGSLVIKRGGTVVKRIRLIGGKSTVTLTRQPKGVQRYVVSYSGSSQVLPAWSPVVRVRVR